MHHVYMGEKLMWFHFIYYMCVIMLWKNDDDDEGKKPNRFLTQLFKKKEDCTIHERWL